MSVLRRAKLRTPDGTESIEYPLGVEAKNVEVANQENLTQRLERIDNNLQDNKEDIAAVNNIAGQNKQNIGAAEVRIDALERRSFAVDKKPYYYNTVADMKADQGLKVGDYAITAGYYEVNDGGAGEYFIINDDTLVDDGGSVHDLTNGLKAELIIDNEINVKQFGAHGNGITDDTNYILKAISFCRINNIKLTASKQDIFLISQSIDISNIYINFNFATIKSISNIDMLIINSEKYYTNIKNINIDCNSIANSGIKIIMGRKSTFENINILNVYNYGWYYLSGYEIIVNNMQIYGINNHDNVGMYNEGGDSYFNNIIIIDCFIAIDNLNGFNYYNNVHGWIYQHTSILTSKFFKISGGKCVLNNCYSDTYFYSIYQYNYIPILIITNFVNVYNHGIMTPEILGDNHPVIMYCETLSGNSLTRICNSNIEGYKNNFNSILTNLDNFSGEIVSSLIRNCDKNISFNTFSSDNRTDGVTEIVSNLNKIGKTIYFDGRFSMDVTDTKTFVLGTLPYFFRPNHEIITFCSYGSGNYNILGVCYLYLNTNGQILVTLPDDITGTVYIKLNQTFINTTEE